LPLRNGSPDPTVVEISLYKKGCASRPVDRPLHWHLSHDRREWYVERGEPIQHCGADLNLGNLAIKVARHALTGSGLPRKP
jgi:hypothetical protein